jgi:hypothetical protein
MDDGSDMEENASALAEEYKIRFAFCIGSLIYLSQTRTDIIFAVNKLAKFVRKPGRKHFDALEHLPRYLWDNNHYGIRLFSYFSRLPLWIHLQDNNLPTDQLLVTMCNSSWNDDVDTRRSTGCFMIFYMGGIVDHSSNMPDPIGMSSAEAEYNQVLLILDSSSAITIGNLFKDMKHTRHIMR